MSSAQRRYMQTVHRRPHDPVRSRHWSIPPDGRAFADTSAHRMIDRQAPPAAARTPRARCGGGGGGVHAAGCLSFSFLPPSLPPLSLSRLSLLERARAVCVLDWTGGEGEQCVSTRVSLSLSRPRRPFPTFSSRNPVSLTVSRRPPPA